MRRSQLFVLFALCCASAYNPIIHPITLAVLDFLTTLLPPVFYAERLFVNKRTDSSDREEFDFIVVGAGASGSAVALRLTERADWNVLLLEAGGEQAPIMTVPFFIGQFQGTDANWHLTTTPQNTSCVLMVDSKCDYPAGRCLGGSTPLHFMLDIRGNPNDFNNWAAMGNDGWSFQDVLPYFKKVEDVEIPELADSDLRGHDGTIKITYANYFSDAGKLILKGVEEAGFPLTEDYNGAQQTGAGRMQTTTTRGGRRSDAYSAYLDEARRRPNLYLRSGSYVTTLVLEGGRVTGVRYVRGGREMQAFASKEVVLSAGAIHSPAILMRSGIGPADHLRELGIPLVEDLPVGHNLMDHAVALSTYVTFNQTIAPDFPGILLNPISFFDYYLRHTGPLTAPASFEVVSYHNLESAETLDWPQIEIMWSSVNLIPDEKFASLFRISQEAFDRIVKPVQNKPCMLAAINNLRPKSRGRIYLLDNNTFSPPQIDVRTLSDADDVEVILAGIRVYEKIISTPSFQAVGAKLSDAVVPGCEDFQFDSDDYWRCAIRRFSITVYHQCGTCKMAPEGDPTGVVTPRLKVVGIDGLRVIDTSVMPMIAGHLQMPAYMIGERGVAFVIEDYASS